MALFLIIVLTMMSAPSGFAGSASPTGERVTLIVEMEDGSVTEGDNRGRTTSFDAENGAEAMLDYAERREAAGNYEAAAKVRALIPKAAAGEANRKIEKFKNNCGKLGFIEEIKGTIRIADAMNGGR